jgi:hypothetical protein
VKLAYIPLTRKRILKNSNDWPSSINCQEPLVLGYIVVIGLPFGIIYSEIFAESGTFEPKASEPLERHQRPGMFQSSRGDLFST